MKSHLHQVQAKWKDELSIAARHQQLLARSSGWLGAWKDDLSWHKALFLNSPAFQFLRRIRAFFRGY